MAQQQTEKLNRLMQGKLLLQQQRETEEQLDAIKGELAETKVIMEGRFQAVEATLEGICRQLSEDWQAGQSSLHKELQEEFWTELLVRGASRRCSKRSNRSIRRRNLPFH